MPGPPPSKNARRKNARPDWRTLPASGFEGSVPSWPIGTAVQSEIDLWWELWRSPQAAAWAELGWTRVVARYLRLLLAAEKSDAPVSLLGEVRQLEDRLGLSPMAMRRLQWEIGEAAEVSSGAAGNVTALDDYRDVLG